jgi:Flp pilus assembly protein TadD
VVADPEQRSNDIVASGTIERITPESTLKSKIAGADERTLARAYAEAGVWYDTIDTLSRLIEKNPDDSALREQRAALLDQVGLKSVADYTRAAER